MMPGIGFEEMILLVLVAIVVIGPKDLPLMMRKFGRFTGKMRAMAFEFKQGFDELGRQAELEELRKEVADLKNMTGLEDLKREFDEDKRNLEQDVNSALADTRPATPALAAPASTPDPTPAIATQPEGEQPASDPALPATTTAAEATPATPPATPAAAAPATPLQREVWPRPHKRKPPAAAPEPAPYAGLSAEHPGYDAGEDFRIDGGAPEPAAKPANGSAPETAANTGAGNGGDHADAVPVDDNVHVIPDDHVRPTHPAATRAPAKQDTTA
jgi:sec-independent protein translocase protein TatB